MTITRDKLIEVAKEAGATMYADTILVNGRNADDFVERFAALLSEAQEGEPTQQVGWIDEFGNVFPLAAWRPSKKTYHDAHKEAWKPVYTPPLSSDQVWNEAIEEAAKVCDVEHRRDDLTGDYRYGAGMCAHHIRSLKRPSQAQEPQQFDPLAVRELAKSFRDNPREASLTEQAMLRQAAATGAVGEQSAISKAKAALYSIGNTLDDAELRQHAKEAYEELSCGEQPAPVTDDLPPLPRAGKYGDLPKPWAYYTADQMREYARAALSRVHAAPDAELLKDGKLFRKLISYQYWHRQELVRHDDVRTAIDKALNKYRTAAPSVNEQGGGK